MEDIVFREITIDRTRADDKKRIVSASLSSSEPYERFFGYEILEHSDDAIDLSRAADGLPLLFSHDRDSIIGVVENVRIEGEKLRGQLRFGNSSQANEIWKDVQDGIIKNMSIGYMVDETEQTGERDGVPEFTVTKWRILEASVVGVPADATVGMGRSYKRKKLKGNEHMKNEKISRSQRRNEKANQKSLEEMQENEAERQTEINAIADAHAGSIPNVRGLAVEAVRNGTSLDDFRKEVMMLFPEATPLNLRSTSNMAGGFGSGGGQKFSLTRAVAALIDPKEQRYAGYEMEVSNELAKVMGRDTSGFFIPVGELSKRELTVGGTGGNLVATDFAGGSFIDVLRASSIVMQRATLLPGLVGDVDIPKKTAGSTAYWIGGDGSDSITGSTPTMSKLTLTPKTVGSLVSVSHKMMTQSGINLDDMLMQDLADTIAIEVDAKAIAGDGLGNTPTGIINTTGVATQVVAAPGAPTHAELVGFETAVLNANVVDNPGMAYLTTPTVSGALKTTVKDSGSGQFLWEEGMVNGRIAQASNNIPANGIVFGSFADLIIGTWGAVEIMADPYGSNFATGSVSLRIMFDVDFALRQPTAFCVNA